MPNDWDGLPDPEPCPFCGGVHLVWLRPRLEFFVCCHNCASRGPTANTLEDAVVRWNKRPA